MERPNRPKQLDFPIPESRDNQLDPLVEVGKRLNVRFRKKGGKFIARIGFGGSYAKLKLVSVPTGLLEGNKYEVEIIKRLGGAREKIF